MQVFRSLEDAHSFGKTAVALGFFDGVHLGHRKVIENAIAHSRQTPGGPVPVVFTFSAEECASVKKNQKTIFSDEIKIALFEEMGVKAVFMPEFSALKNLGPHDFFADVLLGKLCAEALFCGQDFRFGAGGSGNTDTLVADGKNAGVGVFVSPFVTTNSLKISSGALRELLAEGDLAGFEARCGRQYLIDFGVSEGTRIGRTLGFPTMNQIYPAHFVLPAFGVYATRVLVNGVFYDAVTNVGVKPTVGNSEAPAAESFIFGFDGNLYGKKAKTYFCKHLRPEQKFESLGELKAQITRDTIAAKVYFESFDKK